MKKQGGFTLIELVVVIVILGILAVTAAPKFMNLQDDAKVSAVKGLAGAMKGAIGITYGKAAVSGIESASGQSLTVPGVTDPITLDFGYPKGQTDLEAVVEGLEADWKFSPTVTTTASSTIYYGYEGFDCFAVYTPAEDAITPATVTVEGKADNCTND